MFTRLLVSSALLWGLFATVTAVAAEPATARLLKGKTGQGYAIKVIAKENRFKLVSFEADLRCRDGSTLTLIEGGFLWTRPKRDGSFRDAQFGKTDSVYFRGRLTGKRISGKVRLTDVERGSPRCQSRWIGFNASSR